ncbi:hypothetical protein LZC95_40145 [Pendulispora brunnea]|uniref:Uncharacterized protein n=1 Tax=Pendulispora brunnea TaxID=2905690 RepID=A0ABZ2K8G1_9BACT
MTDLTRRALLLAGGAACLVPACRSSLPPARLPVTLVSRSSGNHARAIVNLGLPLPPGALEDPRRIRVLDANGRELPSATRPIESWANDGSARAVQLQTEVDFGAAATVSVALAVGEYPNATRALVPIEETLIDTDGLQGPRVLALLPASWLCESRVAGPQVPVEHSGNYAGYDRAVERHFPGSLRYLDSRVFSTWLFDRTSTWYKQYVRSGDAKFLDAAYRAAHFVRLQTELQGPDAGIFRLKGRDLKYVYPQAMHLHALLSGDLRARAAGEAMARYCLTRWDPWYRPERYAEPPLGVDPEKDRLFWSARHEAYALLGIAHGWEMTGDLVYLRAMREHVDALHAHQREPPDGHPPDGSWRQNWALYDPNETRLTGAASPWMTALLLAALAHVWRITEDARIPEMVVRWCDFLDRKGFQDDGDPFYIVDCFGTASVPLPPGNASEPAAIHSMEIAYSLAMGIFFTRDSAQRARFRKRFEAQFARALVQDLNEPPRAYNWAFHASSELIVLLQNAQ